MDQAKFDVIEFVAVVVRVPSSARRCGPSQPAGRGDLLSLPATANSWLATSPPWHDGPVTDQGPPEASVVAYLSSALGARQEQPGAAPRGWVAHVQHGGGAGAIPSSIRFRRHRAFEGCHMYGCRLSVRETARRG